ncbi:MAG: CopG family transcriptional regulator [Tepidiformaceae bacterium]
MRTIVDLPEEQLLWLASVCAREGISRAEAIRRAVEASMHQNDEADFKRALDAAFGSWKGHGIDALEFERQIRAEWERG